MYSSDRADLAAGRPLDRGPEMYRLAKEVAARCFQPPIYFGIKPRADFEGLPAKWPSDTEWKREQFPQAAGTPTPADRQAAIAAHQPVTDAWGVEWVPVPRSEVQ